MRWWYLSLVCASSWARAETCPQVRMHPGVNPRAYQHLSVPQSCEAKTVFSCPGGELVLSDRADVDRRHVGARCFAPGDPELARLRPRGRETLTPPAAVTANGSVGAATPGSGGREAPAAGETAALKRQALAAGVPEIIFERALANYLELRRQGKTARDCFMAADMTTPGYQGKLWQICLRPEMRVTAMPTHFGSGAGPGCRDHVYRNSSSECAIYFGNRPGYCLTAGGNYVTQEVTRQAGTARPFVELQGLDAGENDNARERRIGIHQTTFADGRDYLARADRARYSNGCITLPTTGATLDPVALSAQTDGGGMALYVYPAKQDVQDMRDKGRAAYWHAGCAGRERRPAWIGASAEDAPTPEEESQRELADWLNLRPAMGRD